MKKGYNCSYNYNPQKTKHCTKCPQENEHHEFECVKYKKYEANKCTMCNKYYHNSDECREINSFPPSTINAISKN
jgi:hypothetical protein